jgi:hypothetical protein
VCSTRHGVEILKTQFGRRKWRRKEDFNRAIHLTVKNKIFQISAVMLSECDQLKESPQNCKNCKRQEE